MPPKLTRYEAPLVTRERGREVGVDLPDHQKVVLDFRGVRVASPSFLDELIKTATKRGVSLTITNASPRIRHSLARLQRVTEERGLASPA